MPCNIFIASPYATSGGDQLGEEKMECLRFVEIKLIHSVSSMNSSGSHVDDLHSLRGGGEWRTDEIIMKSEKEN